MKRLQLPAVRDAAGVLEDDLPGRGAERQLVDARPRHVPGHAEERRPGALLRADPAKPVARRARRGARRGRTSRRCSPSWACPRGRSSPGRGASCAAAPSSPRGIPSGRSPRRRCTRPRPGAAWTSKAKSVPITLFPRKPPCVGFADGALQDAGRADVLAADVDVGGLGLHGPARDDEPLDELVRVALHDARGP